MNAVCFVQAKRKYMEVAQEKQNLEADRAELQQKYAQKAQQARKLQEMFQKLQQENEMLRSGRQPAGSVLAGGQYRSSTPPPLGGAPGDPNGNMVRTRYSKCWHLVESTGGVKITTSIPLGCVTSGGLHARGNHGVCVMCCTRICACRPYCK